MSKQTDKYTRTRRYHQLRLSAPTRSFQFLLLSSPANDENLKFLEGLKHALHIHLILFAIHAQESARERMRLETDNAVKGVRRISGLLDDPELLERANVDLSVDDTSAIEDERAGVDPSAIQAEEGIGKDGAFERKSAVGILDELEGLPGADEVLAVDCAATRGLKVGETGGIEAEELSGGSLGADSDEGDHGL